MPIIFIVTTVILAVLYLLVNICKKKIVRPAYDHVTNAPRSLFILGHVGFCISFLFIASEIISCFTYNDPTALWCIYGIFATFAILFLALIYELYFTYEAIIGNELYIRRFFKTKIIDVNNVRRVENNPKIISFYGKQNKCLFRVSSMTIGIGELIGYINERKSTEQNEEQREAIAQENAVLEKLGREYRASYKERRKKLIRNFSVCGVFVVLAIVLLLYLIRADIVQIIGLGVLYVFAFVVCLLSCLYTLKTELDKDDVWLGNQYQFTNQKVKGASKHKFIMVCVLCASFMVMGGLSSLMLLSAGSEKPNYDEYTPVTGRIEYCREQTGKYSYVAIGFYDIPTEYRLSSIYLDEFDYSFFKEVNKGDKVTIYVDNGEAREFSLRGVSKKQWNNFYYLSTNQKEYFSYDDYVKSNEHNDMVAYVIAGAGIATFAAAAVTIPIAYCVCKKRAAFEEIVIYQ